MLWHQLLKLLVKGTKLTPETTAIDGTLVPSFAFADTTSYSGKHHKTGTKVSVVVDENGIPLALEEAKGSTHDISLATQTIRNIPPQVRSHINLMLADKGYDAAAFRLFLVSYGISSDIPQRELPVVWRQKILDPPKLRGERSNIKRFVVERTNAWTKSFRRLRFRFDYTMLSFSAFLNLAFVVICVRKLMS